MNIEEARQAIIDYLRSSGGEGKFAPFWKHWLVGYDLELMEAALCALERDLVVEIKDDSIRLVRR